jgi:hypothetical protein
LLVSKETKLIDIINNVILNYCEFRVER